MLRIDGLSVAYGAVEAVRAADVRVDEGQVVALLGPNGAGKTTLLSAVVGLVAPRAGGVALEGRSLLGLRPDQIAAQGVALVPEGRRIFGTLTVAENLHLGATGRPRPERERRLRSVLERFGQLEGLLETPADRLSGGEQQQVAIGRALMGEPRLLLLDEPSLGLAPQVVDLVFDTVDELRREGVTVVVVEQHAARAIACADHTYLMSGGRIVFDGTADQIDDSVDLWETYLGGTGEEQR